MTLKRIGAVVVAVALVAGALLVRRTVLDDDDDTISGGTVVTTQPAAVISGELLCITELAALCAGLRAEFPELTVTVEDAGATLDALAALPDDATRPLWVTIQPFPAMVDELRVASGDEPFGAITEPVGASRLAVATQTGRAGVLSATCADRPLWACVGEDAGAPWTDLGGDAAWGRVRPALGDVDGQAIALASFAVAVAGYVGRPDIRSSDWRDDPAFAPWLRRLAGAVSLSSLSSITPLATMERRPSALDIAATSDAEVAAVGGELFDVNYPEPSMWVEAVVAVPEGTSAPEGLTAALTAALSASGWDPPASAAQPLPGPTTMLALRGQWQEVT